jgi:hypothetical protein
MCTAGIADVEHGVVPDDEDADGCAAGRTGFQYSRDRLVFWLFVPGHAHLDCLDEGGGDRPGDSGSTESVAPLQRHIESGTSIRDTRELSSTF